MSIFYVFCHYFHFSHYYHTNMYISQHQHHLTHSIHAVECWRRLSAETDGNGNGSRFMYPSECVFVLMCIRYLWLSLLFAIICNNVQAKHACCYAMMRQRQRQQTKYIPFYVFSSKILKI